MTRHTLVVLALLALPAGAAARPRFSVLQGLPCSACHVNPTGAGGRNEYGRSTWARQILPMNLGTPNGGFPSLDPVIGDWLALGTDVRASYAVSWPRANVPEARALATTHGFLPMQADLYIHAAPSPYFDIYWDQGTFGSQELFLRPKLGIFSLKAGKFVPAFGWRLPDHTVWTREALGFGPRGKDTGLSLLAEHPNVSVELGMFNGAGADAFVDVDRLRAYSGRAEGRLLVGALRLHLGASGYFNRSGHATSRISTARFGGFGGVALGRLAWLFEGDGGIDERYEQVRLRRCTGEPLSSGTTRTTRTAAYHELSMVVVQGLQVGVVYDFQDPDVRCKGDALHRLGLDVSFFPWPSTEIELIVRNSAGNPGNPNGRLFEAIAVLHGYL